MNLTDVSVPRSHKSPAATRHIYRLPFDQQYDNVLIEPGRDEHWVAIVAEAEGLGLRRGWRWKGPVEWTDLPLPLALPRLDASMSLGCP